MSRLSTLVTIMAGLLFAGFAGAAESQPNFVVILADDLGYGDVGFHGGEAKTPRLDALAASGVRLEAHYGHPMCSPTRAALLTGRYASRFGCTAATNDRVLPFATLTLASALKSAGYDTALFGKWHLGSKPEWCANRFGFDRSYGSLAGGVGPYDHRYKKSAFEATWHRDGKLIEEEGHVTDLITAEAVKFLSAPRAKPFLLYVPFTAVHVPIDEPKEWLELNKDVADEGRRLHAASVSHLDASVGRILKALDDAKLRERTLVLFLSDNGAHPPSSNNEGGRYPGKYPERTVNGSNRPWRGHKTQLYEGGIRTPAVASWPGRLKPGEVNAPLHVSDWMPTLCRLAGVKPEKDPKWDGRDVWPVISGTEKPSPRTLYWLGVQKKTSALRHGDMKLIIGAGKEPELYDLAVDPSESKNLAAEKPTVVAELKELLAKQAAADEDALAKDQ